MTDGGGVTLDHATCRALMLSCLSGHGVMVGDQEMDGVEGWGVERTIMSEYAPPLFVGVHNLSPTSSRASHVPL